VCCSCGGALGPCWREVQRGLGCVASSWCVWCSGDLGFIWAEVGLSEQSQVYESLAEECEAVGEARPPRRVCGQARWFSLVLRWECFAEALLEQRDRWSCGSGSLVIALGGGVQVAAGACSELRLGAWLYVGDNGAVCGGFS
jgi:hypothetical protein